MIQISTELNEARLQGVVSFLDTGLANAKVQIYDATRPAFAAPPGNTPLVEVSLTKPCGTVSGGLLTLTQLEDGLIMRSGTATWARVINGDGLIAFDCDVSDGLGTGEIQFPEVTLFAGGAARMTSAVLG